LKKKLAKNSSPAKKLAIDDEELDKLTTESLRKFHKQMRRIPSRKLRFIFQKKQDELVYALNSHSLEKFANYDSNHISYLNNMAKHHKDAPKANDLSMVD
jgi:hypothetical protein